MMKNKGVTYALLVVVALIWYNVFFRVKSNLFGEEAAFTPTATAVPSVASIHRDTFSLKANYRDPFSGVAAYVETPNPQPQEHVAPQPVMVYEEPWPQIVYYGQVKKTDSKTPLAILKIDGMQFYLRNGESILDNYVIGKIYKDSVEVRHKKKRKVIKILK